jgi:ubiquinone biosynthesis protein COQ9
MQAISEIKLKFFEQFEHSIAEFGWHANALRDIENKINVPCHYSDLIFASMQEILSDYADFHDKKFINLLKAQDNIPPNLRAKISLALFTKISIQDVNFVKNTLAFYAKGPHLNRALKHSWQTMNAIWYWAQDYSMDYSFYTKRIILEGIYLASLKYYIADNSANHIDTKNYIAQLVNNVVDNLSKVQKFKLNNLPILRYFF